MARPAAGRRYVLWYVHVTWSPAPSATPVIRPVTVQVLAPVSERQSTAMVVPSGCGSSVNVQVLPAARMKSLLPGLLFDAVRKNSLFS